MDLNTHHDLKRVVALAAAAERAACLQACEDQAAHFGGVAAGPFVTDFGKHTHQAMAAGAQNCAAVIRKRGEP